MTKEEIASFIHPHKLAVLSTTGEDFPESAVIEYADDGLEIVFDTHTTSRKFQNIQKSSNVSLVIGWDENMTVQYEGVAAVLNGNDLEHCKNIYFEKNPDAQKWEAEKDIAYIRVSPSWIRFTNLNTKPWTVVEFQF
jgi:general stress protein 26